MRRRSRRFSRRGRGNRSEDPRRVDSAPFAPRSGRARGRWGVSALTKEEFAQLTAYEKGYVVYWCGAREDQPNVPESYEPSDGERADYKRGQMQAVLDAQDSE